MCGITGILGSGASVTGLITTFASALAHRGPNAEGHWVDPVARIALAHRRLSILDLSPAGAQPMVSADGRWVLAFNGEIYNYKELRAQLDAVTPRTWRGSSDTEVLLEAVATWGIEATLSRCNGMFALAAWDRSDGTLVLARDRTGEKPLYVGAVGSDLVFASELKAFRRHPAWCHAVEPQALRWLLEFGYVPAPWSIHPGVFKLPAGSLLRLTAADAFWRPDVAEFGSRVVRWWQLEEVIAQARAAPWTEGEAAALDAVGTLINDAVRVRMAADVSVGALLSGGIDSTLVVDSMVRQSTRPVRTFTLGFDDLIFDEGDVAAVTANHLGTEHTHLQLTASAAIDFVERLPSVYDEPFADAAQIPALMVAEAVRREVSVVLTGDGGDEIFHGYQRYLDAERIWRLIGIGPSSMRMALADTFSRTARVLSPGPISQRLLRQGLRLGARNADDYGRALMRFDGAQSVELCDDPAWPPIPSVLSNATVSERMRWRDQSLALPEGIHTKLDRASMAVGLEMRVPFLDPRLISLAWRIPTDWHRCNGIGKRLLRRLATDVAPKKVARLRKHGFDVPIAEWLRGPLRPWAEELLTPVMLACDPLLDPRYIRELWKDHIARRADYGYALWAVLMYRAWSERYG